MANTLAPDNDAQPAPRQSPLRQLAEVVLILLVFFVIGGEPSPHVNESHYLPRLKHFWNPSWCKGDLFLESKEGQLVFVWTFGWVTRCLSLAATAWVGRVLAWTLLAWAWQRLSWRLTPVPLAAVLSSAIFVTLNERVHLAGEWVVGGVEAKCFAYGFVLLALAELAAVNASELPGIFRRNRKWLLLGAATAFHPIVGGWSALVCGVIKRRDILLFRSPTQVPSKPVTRRKSRMSPFVAITGFGLPAAAGIVPALMLTWNEPAEVVAQASRIYVFERLPHHLALLTLPSSEMAWRLGRHAVLLAALVLLCRAVQESRLRRIAQFAWGGALLAAIGLAIELVLWNHPLAAAMLLRYYWFRLTDFAAPLAVGLYLTTQIAAGLERGRPWAAWMLMAAIVVAGWHLSSRVGERLQNPVPPADARVRDFPAWVDACRWVAENTPNDALFLTPRRNQTFKWRAGRPEVANRKDIPQDARSILEWDRRIKEVYYSQIAGVQQPLDSIGLLGTERVRESALKFGADYVLMDRGQLLSLPRVYWNEEYVVYRIDDRSARAGK